MKCKNLGRVRKSWCVRAFLLFGFLFYLQLTRAHAQYNTAEEKGLPSQSTFAGGDIDTVNLQNGNLHVNLPIYSERQRGGKTLDWSLIFDTQTWVKTYYSNNCSPCTPMGVFHVNVDHGVPAWWRPISPSSSWQVINTYQGSNAICPNSNQPYVPVTNWYAVDPQGTQHALPLREEPDGSCYGQTLEGPALDGSGIFYNSQNNILYLKDGTQITPSAIRDTNGNLYTSSSSEDANGRIPVIVTNGSTIVYTTPNGITLTGPSSTTYTVKDSNGNSQVTTVQYEGMDVTSNLCSIPATSTLPCTEAGLRELVIKSVTLPDMRSYTFAYNNNSPGEIASITLPTGATISYTYSNYSISQLGAKGGPPTIISAPSVSGRTVTDDGTTQSWTYAIAGGKAVVTDPVGDITTHLFSHINAANNSNSQTTSEYETSTTYQDSKGNTLRSVATSYTAEYNSEWAMPVNVRPISVTTTLDNGQVEQKQTDYETFSYNDYLGAETATRMNATEVREYDFGASAPGSLLRRTDYSYLHSQAPAYAALNIVNRISGITTYNGAGSQASQTLYEYDNYTHPNQPFLGSGAVQHDSTFTVGYSTRGNPTAVSVWRSTDGATLSTTKQYDDAGNILSIIDPLGRQTSFSFADSWVNSACIPSGNSAAFPTKVTNAKGQIATSAYNSCPGTLASITDANGQTTKTTYDFVGRIATVSYPDLGLKTLCYSDNPNGTCYSSTTLESTETNAISGSVNMVQTTLYDSLGRIKETQLTSDPQVVYTDTQYDQDGRPYKVSNPYRTGDTVYWTTNSYDGLSRLTRVVKTDTSSTSTVYTGNITTITDEAGNVRKSQTNAIGQLTGVWEDPLGLNYETDYEYTVLGDLISATQRGSDTNSANWRVRTFTYDSLRELLCAANPETTSPLAAVATCPVTDTGKYIAGTTRYQYDSNGELISKTAPLQNQQGLTTVATTYTYDVLRRPIARSYSDGTPAVTYSYDGDAMTACTPPTVAAATNRLGRMSAMCDASGATAWSYDSVGRNLFENRIIGAVTDQIGYTYYLNGNINTVTYPQSGAATPLVLTYNVNTAGRTYSVVGSSGVTYAQVKSTWASGAADVTQLGSNIQHTDTYNSRLQPLSEAAEQINTTNTLFSRSYNFNLGANDNGNLYGVQDGLDQLGLNRPNGSVKYTYDKLNRISSATTLGTTCTMMAGGTLNWGSTYTIDAYGNLTVQTPTLCAAPSASSTATTRNQLASATYDSSGKIMQSAGQSYQYNAEGQMTSGAGSTYVYDGMGERVEKPGKYYWKGVGSTALVETNTSDRNPTQYIFFNGARIARIDPGATTPKYYLSDNVGSTAVETDSLGNTLNMSLFFPYGVERVITQGDTANNYKFTGKERDAETGLDDFGARYYNSTLGRFMTPDWDSKATAVPYANFGDPQTLNLYSYVENGPLNRVDAYGHVALNSSAGLIENEKGECSPGPIKGQPVSQNCSASIAPDGLQELETQQDEEHYEALLSADALNASLASGDPPGAQQQTDKTTTTVTTTTYSATASGVHIVLLGTVTGSDYQDFNWVQTVTTTDPMHGNSANTPYADTDPGQKTPYYWNPTEQTQYEAKGKAQGGSTVFSDAPSRPFSGKSISWHADLSLVGIKKDGSFDRLKSFSYGFTLDAKGVHIQPLVGVP